MASELELERSLRDLGLEQYLSNCLRAGIQSWQSLSTITEEELIAIGIRVGHRRKLQRAVARGLLWPDNRPLPTASELTQHRQDLRRLTRGRIDPELLEENYYSLASSVQSPWSRESFSNDTDGSSEDGTSIRVTDVLRTSSRLFPIAVSSSTESAQDLEADISQIRAEDIEAVEQEKVARVLRDLDALGIHIPASESDPLPEVELGHKSQSLDDVMPHGANSGSSRRSPDLEAEAAARSQPLGTFFEAFLQSFNHFLFLFSEAELRQSFNPREQTSDADLPVDIYLVLALGAKASVFQAEDIRNEWYSRARLRLLTEDCHDDLWMMRVLTLICIFEIDDDIDVACRFLSMISRWLRHDVLFN
jgi:hypothetical protein